MDYYAASLSITYLAFFEVVAIAWFYGVGRLSRNIKQMTGQYSKQMFIKLDRMKIEPFL